MKISRRELIEMGACKDGLRRFIKQTNGTSEAVEASSLVGGENTYSDLLWLVRKKLPKDKIVRFACDCALINIDLIKPFTDKFDLIVEVLSDPNAYAAAADAAAAAAAYAAYAAAAAYADAAAYAAYAAADAAADADAAAYAAYAAAYANSEKVNELLRGLFE